jgi:hypothetical protein
MAINPDRDSLPLCRLDIKRFNQFKTFRRCHNRHLVPVLNTAECCIEKHFSLLQKPVVHTSYTPRKR